MIEINLAKLDRGTKTEWRTVTRGGKTFKQRFKVGKKEKEIEKFDLISNLKNLEESNEDFVIRHGWNTEKSEYFRHIKDNTNIFMIGNKICGMTELSDLSLDILRVRLLEINPDMRRHGYGVTVMKKIAKKALSHEVEMIALNSAGENSDKFYTAIGMTKIGLYGGKNSYVGDAEWMKKFIEA